LRWIGLTLLGLVLLFALFLIGLNSDAGRRFVVTQVEKYEFENGMKIGIGRLDGSLYGQMVIRDFTLSDPKGVFLASPEVRVDWRPIRYLANHIDVRSATAATMTMRKMPEFKVVPDTGEPLAPRSRHRCWPCASIGSFSNRRFRANGRKRGSPARSRSPIAARRSAPTAETIGANAKGDTLKLLLDAVPEANRLAVTLDVNAPQGGVLAAMGGFKEPLVAKLDGRGDWKVWNGNLTANLGAAPLARSR
jgi:translocation and assembly module TamB